MSKIRDDRNRKIYKLRAKGWTLQEIGDYFNLTRERVRQILGVMGYTQVRESKTLDKQLT